MPNEERDEVDRLEPPTPTKLDTAAEIGKALLSDLPLPLPTATGLALLDLIVTPPLEKRREEWMREVSEALRTLKGVTIEDLRDDPAFIDIIVSASQAAVRTSDLEKRKALRNAVVNAAGASNLSTDTKLLFVGLVDELTPLHLRVLDLVDEPLEWAKRHDHQFPKVASTGRMLVITHAFQELKGDYDLVLLLWRRLWNHGLVSIESLGATTTTPFEQMTSSFGRSFLRFIRRPAKGE